MPSHASFSPTLRTLLSAIVPMTCQICGRSLRDPRKVMCLHCELGIRPTYSHLNNKTHIHDRLARLFPVRNLLTWFPYLKNDPYSNLLRQAKYAGRPMIAQSLATDFACFLKEEGLLPDDYDCLIPVPMHPLKKLRRGYNQAEIIAQSISHITAIPIVEAIKATHSRQTQTHLGAIGRAESTKNAFTLKAPYTPKSFAGKNIIIVDDIITTGSTVEAMLRALLTPGPIPNELKPHKPLDTPWSITPASISILAICETPPI